MMKILRLISIAVGFIAALSFMRSLSTSFNWYAQLVFGNFAHFGRGPSWVMVLFSMSFIAVTTLAIKKREKSILGRMDFSLVLTVCAVGFYACFLLLTGQMLTPWEIWQTTHNPAIFTLNMSSVQMMLIVVPVVAYLLAVFAFIQLVARLRDKDLLASMYWLWFFKTYGTRPISIVAAVALTSQFVLIIFAQNLLLVLVSLMVICILTYFVAFMLKLSEIYNAANEDKIRAERFKTELITNVSHDIKTPLTSIINYVDLLKKENLQGHAGEHLQVLERKSARLKILIDDLMEASKAGTGNLKADIQVIDMGEIVGQAAGEFEDSFAQRNLTIVLRNPSEPVKVLSDSRHLYRTLENLFSNAEKYALEGTRVFAEITTQGEKVIFTLQNTAKELLEQSGADMTAQFMRGDKARSEEGSGLGLYIAKSLMELCGAQFYVKIYGDMFMVEITLRGFLA